MPVSPLSISDWQKILVIDHHNHLITLDPLHAVADTASSFIPEFCICSSIDAVADILTHQSQTRRALADISCAEVIADACSRLAHSFDNAVQLSVPELHVTKLIEDKINIYPQYDRGTPNIDHELGRIRSLLKKYACEDTYYFSEVFVESPSQNVTVSLAPNLSCSEFLPPLVVTDNITHQFGYHPKACIDSLYMSLFIERINIMMRHSNRNIIIIMHNHLLVDDRKFSNVKLYYINPAVDRYCTEKLEQFLKFPDDYGLNYWLASILQTRLTTALKFRNSNLAVSAVLVLYNDSIEKLLRTADFVYFNLVSVAQSKFTGEDCGKSFFSKSFELVNGLILAKDRVPHQVPDLSQIFHRATKRYFPLPRDIQGILVDLKAYQFSSLETAANLPSTWELIFDTLYPFLLANDSDEILGKFNAFLLSFADKYADAKADTVVISPPPPKVSPPNSLRDANNTALVNLVTPDLHQSTTVSLPSQNATISSSSDSSVRESKSTSSRAVSTDTPLLSKGTRPNLQKVPCPKDIDLELDSEATAAEKIKARFEIIGDIVPTNVISQTRTLRPRKRSASQNMVKNIKKSKIIEAFEKNHLSFIATPETMFFSDNSDESSDESFDPINNDQIKSKNDSSETNKSSMLPNVVVCDEASAYATNSSHTPNPSTNSRTLRNSSDKILTSTREGVSHEALLLTKRGMLDVSGTDPKLHQACNSSVESDTEPRAAAVNSISSSLNPEVVADHAMRAPPLGYNNDTSPSVNEMDMTGTNADPKRISQLDHIVGFSDDTCSSSVSPTMKPTKPAAKLNLRKLNLLDFAELNKASRTRIQRERSSRTHSDINDQRGPVLSGSASHVSAREEVKLSGSADNPQENAESSGLVSVASIGPLPAFHEAKSDTNTEIDLSNVAVANLTQKDIEETGDEKLEATSKNRISISENTSRRLLEMTQDDDDDEDVAMPKIDQKAGIEETAPQQMTEKEDSLLPRKAADIVMLAGNENGSQSPALIFNDSRQSPSIENPSGAGPSSEESIDKIACMPQTTGAASPQSGPEVVGISVTESSPKNDIESLNNNRIWLTPSDESKSKDSSSSEDHENNNSKDAPNASHRSSEISAPSSGLDLSSPMAASSLPSPADAISPPGSKTARSPTTPVMREGHTLGHTASVQPPVLLKRDEIDHLIKVDPQFVALISRQMSGSAKAKLKGMSALEKEEFFAAKIAKLALSADARYQKSVSLPLVSSLISKYYSTGRSPTDTSHAVGPVNIPRQEAKEKIRDTTPVDPSSDSSGAELMDADAESTFLQTPSHRPKVPTAAAAITSIVESPLSKPEFQSASVALRIGLPTLNSVKPIVSDSFKSMQFTAKVSNNKALSSFLIDLDSNDSRVMSDSDSDVLLRDLVVLDQIEPRTKNGSGIDSSPIMRTRKPVTKLKQVHEITSIKLTTLPSTKSALAARGLPLLRDLPPPKSEPVVVKKLQSKSRNINILDALEDSDTDSDLDNSDSFRGLTSLNNSYISTPQKTHNSVGLILPLKTTTLDKDSDIPAEKTPKGSARTKHTALKKEPTQKVVKVDPEAEQPLIYQGFSKLRTDPPKETFKSRESSKFKPKTNSIAKPYLIRNGTKPRRDSKLLHPIASAANSPAKPTHTLASEVSKRKVYNFIDKLAERESSSESELD